MGDRSGWGCLPSGPPWAPLRVSTPEEPPPQSDEQPDHHGRRENGPAAQGRPQGLHRAHLNAVKVQKAPHRPGLSVGPEAGNGVAPEPNLHGKARDVEGLVDATGRPCPLSGSKRPRGEKTAPGSEARQVHDDPVSGPPNVDAFAVNGQLEIGENFEGKGHVRRVDLSAPARNEPDQLPAKRWAGGEEGKDTVRGGDAADQCARSGRALVGPRPRSHSAGCPWGCRGFNA